MAEKKVIELEIKTDSVGSLKSELRKAQAEVAALSEKFGATSQEAINAAKKAAELKDAIGDAKALTDAFNPDAKFNALSASIGGVLNGFQAFEGALGLIGVESSAIQETLLKVQSAMALSQGVQGLMEAKDSFIQLKAVIGQTAIGQKVLAVATNIGAVAMKAFNAVLKANPIGLVIAGITALVGAIAFFTRETGNAKEAADAYTKSLENQRRAIDENFSSLEKRQSERISLMKAQGATEQQLFEQEQKNTKKLAEEKQKAHNKEKYSYQNLRRLYKQLMDQGNEEEAAAIREQLKTSRERYNELSKQSKDYYRQLALDNKINVAENAQKVKENAEKVRQNAIEVQKQEAEDRKAAAQKRKEENERIKQEQLEKQKALYDLEQKSNEERLKKQEEVYNLELSLIKDSREKEIQELINSYDTKFETVNGNAELEKQLTEQLNSEIAVINTKYADIELEKEAKLNEQKYNSKKGFLEAQIIQDENNFKARYDLLELQRQKELENKELTEGEITAIEAKYAQQRKEISKDEKAYKQQTNDFIFESTKQTLDLISGITEIFGKKGEKEARKAFQIQKAVSIAQATIDTYKSANAIFAAAAANPATVLFPAQPFIAAGLAVAAGLVNVAKIASQKFQSTSTPSGGGSTTAPSGLNAGTGAAITPNFNIVGNAQATNPLTGLGSQPIQAYVVSGDVTTAQSLDRNRVNYATFG